VVVGEGGKGSLRDGFKGLRVPPAGKGRGPFAIPILGVLEWLY